MKNRRNTRRGRAKRWRCVDGAMVMPSNGGAAIVERCVTSWYVEVWSASANLASHTRHASRARAMQCAEAWGKVLRQCFRPSKLDGFALAA